MTGLLAAGFVAGARQLVAIVLLTLLISLTTLYSEAGSSPIVMSVYLPYAYAFLAVGCSLTAGRPIEITAERMRFVYNSMRKPRQDKVLISLAAQLSFASLLCAILSFRVPPSFALVLDGLLGGPTIVQVIWSAALSVGVAFFGGSAHAAISAINRRGA